MGDKIQDFGKKIGGAKKDLSSGRSLTVDDINNWNDLEKNQYLTKNNVWKVPNYQKMVDEGKPIEVVYYIKKIRDSLPSKPFNNTEKYQNGYIEFVNNIKEKAMNLATIAQVQGFFEKEIKGKYAEQIQTYLYKPMENAYGCLNSKVFKAMQKPSLIGILGEIEKKQFLFTDEQKILSNYQFCHYDGKNVQKEESGNRTMLTFNQGYGKYFYYNNPPHFENMDNWKKDTYFVIGKREILAINFEDEKLAREYVLNKEQEKNVDNSSNKEEKTTSSRKKKFTPPQLETVKRIGGEDYLNGEDITGEKMLKDFSFKGGEFGNWESQNDRQANLNMSYESFRDLAVALNIKSEDISLKGNLSIAYGSRGHGSALAHYEPARKVINLTKMKGAGSLAHEWCHALDHFIAEETKMGKSFASDEFNHGEKENLLLPVIMAMKFKEENGKAVTTDYLIESKKADTQFSKQDNGYWSSKTEMLARAFACYVRDKLEEKGIRDDFLCGHSEMSVVPQGEERKIINKEFDKLIDKLKEMELLHAPVIAEKAIAKEQNQEETYSMYQLKKDNEYNRARFQSFDENKNDGFVLNYQDYEKVYEGSFKEVKGEDINEKLENLYSKFNINKPENYKGRSLSMSDVIEIKNKDEQKAYYVDAIGFRDFPEFLKEKPEYKTFNLNAVSMTKMHSEQKGYHVQIVPKEINKTGEDLYYSYKSADCLPKEISEYVKQKEQKLNDFVLKQLKTQETLCAVECTNDYSNPSTPFNDKDGIEKYRIVAINAKLQMIENVNDVVYESKDVAEKDLEKLCEKNSNLVSTNNYNEIIYEIGKLFVEHVEKSNVEMLKEKEKTKKHSYER